MIFFFLSSFLAFCVVCEYIRISSYTLDTDDDFCANIWIIVVLTRFVLHHICTSSSTSSTKRWEMHHIGEKQHNLTTDFTRIKKVLLPLSIHSILIFQPCLLWIYTQNRARIFLKFSTLMRFADFHWKKSESNMQYGRYVPARVFL
jgi:hypothetical protein